MTPSSPRFLPINPMPPCRMYPRHPLPSRCSMAFSSYPFRPPPPTALLPAAATVFTTPCSGSSQSENTDPGRRPVGTTLAENLAAEANDITIVDKHPQRLADLRDRLDIQTVLGHASHPDVLRQAGADDTDLLIAVTNSDEVNMVACQVCYSLFRTPTKIARIRSASFHGRDGFFSQDHMPIDVLINPEEAVTDRNSAAAGASRRAAGGGLCRRAGAAGGHEGVLRRTAGGS